MPLITGSEIMTLIFMYNYYFYYIAAVTEMILMFVNDYISQFYLFVVATNVGYLKRFYGL